MNKKVIIIAGPTAVGKTKYAIDLAIALDGEIVSADSMQIYKFMNIGSAKPTAEEMKLAKHHLVDEIDPRSDFSVAQYQALAKDKINQIFQDGKIPIVSGGTGLYLNALIYDMDFSVMPRREGYRETLEAKARKYGNEYVHQILHSLDPAAASRIHPNNLKKVIRALEVVESTGEGIKEFQASFVPVQDYESILIGLTRNRDELYDRINSRVDQLIEAGLVNEIQSLLEKGLTTDHISMKGIGYKEIIGFFNGEYGLEEAIEMVKRNTRHYAKRQLTWMRRYEKMKWFNLSDYDQEKEALRAILGYIKFKLSV